MTQLEIIRKVAADSKLPFKVCRAIVDLFWEQVAADLEGKTGRARIPGFGTFRRKLRQARISRPPKGAAKEVFSPSRYNVAFKPASRRKSSGVKAKKS